MRVFPGRFLYPSVPVSLPFLLGVDACVSTSAILAAVSAARTNDNSNKKTTTFTRTGEKHRQEVSKTHTRLPLEWRATPIKSLPNVRAFPFRRWVGRRMQREDLAFSNMGLADKAFVPATSRYLDACHRLAESTGMQVCGDRREQGEVFRAKGKLVAVFRGSVFFFLFSPSHPSSLTLSTGMLTRLRSLFPPYVPPHTPTDG